MAAAGATTTLFAAASGGTGGEGSRVRRRSSVPPLNTNNKAIKRTLNTAAALEQLRFPSRFDTVDPVIDNLRKYDQCATATGQHGDNKHPPQPSNGPSPAGRLPSPHPQQPHTGGAGARKKLPRARTIPEMSQQAGRSHNAGPVICSAGPLRWDQIQYMNMYANKLDVNDDQVEDVDDEIAAMPAVYFDDLVNRGIIMEGGDGQGQQQQAEYYDNGDGYYYGDDGNNQQGYYDSNGQQLPPDEMEEGQQGYYYYPGQQQEGSELAYTMTGESYTQTGSDFYYNSQQPQEGWAEGEGNYVDYDDQQQMQGEEDGDYMDDGGQQQQVDEYGQNMRMYYMPQYLRDMIRMEEDRARRFAAWQRRRQRILLEMAVEEIARRVMHEAKEVVLMMKEKNKARAQRQMMALMLIELARRHVALLKEVADVRVIKHYKHQDAKRRITQMVISQWMQNLKYRRIFNKEQRKHGIMLRFIANCKRRTNGTKRRGAADVIRLFLVNARDETTKNAFSRFKKRIAVAQRQARHFIECRRSRLYVMGTMWKKALKEKRELLDMQLKKQEMDLLSRAMQNANTVTVIRRLQHFRWHIRKNLRRAVIQAKKAREQRAALLGQAQEVALMDDDDFSPKERAILVRMLWELRRNHFAADDAMREKRDQRLIATVATAKTLIKANEAEVLELSRGFCNIKQKINRFSNFAMFFGHSMSRETQVPLRAVVEREVEAYLVQEFEEKQQRQLEHLLKNLGHQATGTRVFLRKTSQGFALELAVTPTPPPQEGGKRKAGAGGVKGGNGSRGAGGGEGGGNDEGEREGEELGGTGRLAMTTSTDEEDRLHSQTKNLIMSDNEEEEEEEEGAEAAKG